MLPLGQEHINLIGKYQFAPQPGRSSGDLSQYRKPSDQRAG
ncbi:MAG TPA: hypothetical protein VL485_18385 [Ktedonobacteraceae bacterium]|nr:hypothetical protein [Ktedonobacteraceae bacterium]